MRKQFIRRGDDLIQLINDILDLSKIESGFISANFSSVSFRENCQFCGNNIQANFRGPPPCASILKQIARCPELIQTDQQRLNQILKNLLSNSLQVYRERRGKIKDLYSQ